MGDKVSFFFLVVKEVGSSDVGVIFVFNFFYCIILVIIVCDFIVLILRVCYFNLNILKVCNLNFNFLYFSCNIFCF